MFVKYINKVLFGYFMSKISIMNVEVSFFTLNNSDYISLTDIAKYKSPDYPADIIKNWIRRKDTIEFLGLWELINNSNFNMVEFNQFKMSAGHNSFVLSPTKWILKTNAIGLKTKSGKYGGGTLAHSDIAFEFASWISAEFKLYLIKEFQRLKQQDSEKQNIEWNVVRLLSRLNYDIHKESIRINLTPPALSKKQIMLIYALEADVLNVALFGMTAKEWKMKNKKLKGNIRDYANVAQLICLSNLESLNAHFISEGLSQASRLVKLNKLAISQMKILNNSNSIKKFIN